MKAVQLEKYDATPELVDVADPEVTSPLDVVVRIGGAGVCRTDRDGYRDNTLTLVEPPP